MTERPPRPKMSDGNGLAPHYWTPPNPSVKTGVCGRCGRGKRALVHLKPPGVATPDAGAQAASA